MNLQTNVIGVLKVKKFFKKMLKLLNYFLQIVMILNLLKKKLKRKFPNG